MSGAVGKLTKAATFGLVGEEDLFGQRPGQVSYDPASAEAAQRRAAEINARFGTYGVDSPLGQVQVVQNPDGTFSRKFTQSEADVQRQSLIGQGLGGLSLDPQRAEEAFYGRATRLLTPQFERQRERLDESLINRGIGVGSEQYRQSLEDLRNQQSGQLQDIASRAVTAAPAVTGSQISNINQLAAGRDIGALSGMGGQIGSAGARSTYDQQFAAQQANQQAQRAFDQQNMQMLGGLLGAGIGAFSDKRLKENLTKVGKLDNGLDVYIGNYNKKALKLDPTLSDKPQLFLIAQEVNDKRPEAVMVKDGYLAVNYRKAVV